MMLFTVGQMQRTESGKTAKNSVDSDFQHFFFHWLNDNTGVFCFVCFVECTVEQEINTKMHLHRMVLSTSMYKKKTRRE